MRCRKIHFLAMAVFPQHASAAVVAATVVVTDADVAATVVVIVLLLLRSISRAQTLSPHVARNWVVRCRSSIVPQRLLVVDSSCGHNWCLCCCKIEQTLRMWWTVCSASLQSQSAESMMPVRFRSTRGPQCPVRNLNIVVCSCLARRLIGSEEWL